MQRLDKSDESPGNERPDVRRNDRAATAKGPESNCCNQSRVDANHQAPARVGTSQLAPAQSPTYGVQARR